MVHYPACHLNSVTMPQLVMIPVDLVPATLGFVSEGNANKPATDDMENVAPA